MKKLFLTVITIFSFANATPKFPALTGMVVDNANMISTVDKLQLTNMLKKENKETSNEVVVLTINSLEGNSIEEYGVELGRHWGIGKKKNNNGVILIVSKRDRKVRIEVGYGLEGALTDALSKSIIDKTIIPSFKKGEFSEGILNGAKDIIKAVHNEYKVPEEEELSSGGIIIIIIFIILFIFIVGIINSSSGGSGGSYGGSYSSGSYGGSSGGSSGGGGSFGGGGGSGGW